jgi:type IV pilus assembly protein PilC
MAFLIAIFIAVAQLVAVAAAIGLGTAAVTRARRASLLWLLAIITSRRLPLAAELEALGDGMLRRDRGAANAIAAKVRNGASLGEALASGRGLVSNDAVLLARVGEKVDCLGDAFGREAERLARAREQMVSTTTSPTLAMVYLVLVPLIIPIIVTGLMVYIVPKLQRIFADFGVELPWATQKLIESSDVLAQYWWIAVASLLAVVMCGGTFLVLMKVYAWDLHLPRWFVPGGRSGRASLALRALVLPVLTGRPLGDALQPLANAPDAGDRWKFGRIKNRYESGANLWQLLSEERIISSRDAQLLAAAEKAGNLAWALDVLADRIDERRWRWLAMSLEFVQPLIVFVLGALVLFICLGIFMPLVQMISELS